MNDFEKHLQSKELSKATIKHYNTQAMCFIVWCDMENIEPETAGSTDITGYIKYLQTKGSQNKTNAHQIIILKHFFNWQISKGQREDNPAKHIKIRGSKTTILYPLFTKQELENIYHTYEVPKEDDARNNRNWFTNYKLSRQRNKAVLSLMIYQGLCTDEINRLTIKDIKLKEGTIFISGTRKSIERILELKPHQIMELMEYQLTVRNELQKLKPVQTELYFLPVPSAGKKTISSNDGINIWKRLSEEIRRNNKRYINFLQIRTSVITHWLKQYNLRQVQYMAGHKYVSSTERYLVGQIEDLQADIDQYHPIG
jgi:site-specific recombinase XerD